MSGLRVGVIGGLNQALTRRKALPKGSYPSELARKAGDISEYCSSRGHTIVSQHYLELPQAH